MTILFLVGRLDDAPDLNAALEALRSREDDVSLVPDAHVTGSIDGVRRLAEAWDLRVAEGPVLPFSVSSFLAGEYVRADGERPLPEALVLASPRDAEADAFLRAENPDAVVYTPMTEPGAAHASYVRSARALGIPTVPYAAESASWAEALHSVGASAPRVEAPLAPAWWPLVRPVVMRVAARVARGDGGRAAKSARQAAAAERRDRTQITRRAELAAAKSAAAAAERESRKQAAAARKEAERCAYEASIDQAYANYQRIRAWARRIEAAGAVAVTSAERDTIAALAPLWEADRATIASLRRRLTPITGVSASDYEPASDDLDMSIRRDIIDLRKQVGAGIAVQEAPVLGVFGVLRNGGWQNADTMRHYRMIAALKDGGILTPFRRAGARRIVWEIGGGWGGFAYQFKTLCPNVTYVITGLPELLMVSAVYLMAAFPDARVRLVEPGASGDDPQQWEDVDFVFAPESALAWLKPPRLDLAVDIAAMRSMTDERMRTHIRHAFACGARYFYSTMVGGVSAPVARIWRELEALFWVHPVPPRRAHGMASADAPIVSDDETAHLVGWRRLQM